MIEGSFLVVMSHFVYSISPKSLLLARGQQLLSDYEKLALGEA